MHRRCPIIPAFPSGRTTPLPLLPSCGGTGALTVFPGGFTQKRHSSVYPQPPVNPLPPYPPYASGYQSFYHPHAHQGVSQVPPPFNSGMGASGYVGVGVPELGTKERPVVVVSAPQKTTWTTRLWLLLLFGIGASCTLSLIEELMSRMQDGNSVTKIGGISRGQQIGMFGSPDVKPVDLTGLDVTFDTIRGCDEAKKELKEIVEFLKEPEKFHKLGGRLPKGALLVGPPGCGKTMLAKAIAKEADVSFFYSAGSEFDEMFVGVGSRRVRELFAAAKARAPSLIFIDEIDALGGKRSGTDHAYSRMTLNQLLAEMDGFDSKDSVIVIAATNTPDSLDKALTRPGRFDVVVSVDPPDMKGREEVLQIYLSKIKAESSVSAAAIARGTTGFTGAELSNLVNIAAIRAATLNKQVVTMNDIEYAKDRVMMGAESAKVIPEDERKVTAYHEGGHALAALLLEKEGAEPVHKATIVPRGNGIMGLVQQLPEKDRYSQSKRQCLARLKVCLAGRVGEEILLGSDDVTTGASSDFHQATKIARNMVRRFGFSGDLGFVDYESSDTPEGAYMSDETKGKIEKEVSTLLQNSYTEIKQMLLSHREELESIAKHLMQHETLSGDELKRIVNGETLPARKEKVSIHHHCSKMPPAGTESMKGKQRPVSIT
ncbi:metallo-peptidase, Clan MA(E) Family M41 [Trypanosoma brucei gambiense DAL972]|uniref:Mitochondrial ATP-dependent zinc metallopeptidase, putative n=2 Tax=Trypanosoma brucei TaxID=5691 RepID=D0A3J7_TRYB9|nr:metallo-peptidase, Clan MA(E) Family M41 [Trypanosoma brucei gambiense DAL972]CBH15841.1 metallo-peptidase, Clan MA(E) Family M41 [Trypanosoma brucei gambiense DAL972]|eukprot:XP_011778105.1 metallo-peptidase, Clan MA(E) Family M41 [Trypanosoma brucei gambiense DAL972]